MSFSPEICLLFVAGLGGLTLWSFRERVRKKAAIRALLVKWARLAPQKKREILTREDFIRGMDEQSHQYKKTRRSFLQGTGAEGLPTTDQCDGIFSLYIQELVSTDRWLSSRELEAGLAAVAAWFNSQPDLDPSVGTTSPENDNKSPGDNFEV